jgi:hypothetical protein
MVSVIDPNNNNSNKTSSIKDLYDITVTIDGKTIDMSESDLTALAKKVDHFAGESFKNFHTNSAWKNVRDNLEKIDFKFSLNETTSDTGRIVYGVEPLKYVALFTFLKDGKSSIIKEKEPIMSGEVAKAYAAFQNDKGSPISKPVVQLPTEPSSTPANQGKGFFASLNPFTWGSTQFNTNAPAKQVEAPAKQVEAPVKQVEAPVKQVEAPVKQVEAPVKQVEAPVKQVEAPAKQVEAPAKQTSAPVLPSSAPAQPNAKETVVPVLPNASTPAQPTQKQTGATGQAPGRIINLSFAPKNKKPTDLSKQHLTVHTLISEAEPIDDDVNPNLTTLKLVVKEVQVPANKPVVSNTLDVTESIKSNPKENHNSQPLGFNLALGQQLYAMKNNKLNTEIETIDDQTEVTKMQKILNERLATAVNDSHFNYIYDIMTWISKNNISSFQNLATKDARKINDALKKEDFDKCNKEQQSLILYFVKEYVKSGKRLNPPNYAQLLEWSEKPWFDNFEYPGKIIQLTYNSLDDVQPTTTVLYSNNDVKIRSNPEKTAIIRYVIDKNGFYSAKHTKAKKAEIL